ncbi:TraR/DksA family transcriptional regulator [Blastococcus sp. SYSU D00669]
MTVPVASPVRTARPTTPDPFRVLLEEQRADCVRQRDAALAETVSPVPDPVAVRRAAGLQRTVEEIDAALARIAAGTYGVCTGCGGTIPAERLEFRPHAATCVACAQPER